MKKLTVMAACAALLLGGGVFMKTNQKLQSVCSSLIEALSQIEQWQIEGADGEVYNYWDNMKNTQCYVPSNFGWSGGMSGSDPSFSWSFTYTYIWCCKSSTGTVCHQDPSYIEACRVTGNYLN